MLTRAVFAAIDGALRAAPNILPHAAVEFIFGFCAFGHRVLECCADEREQAPTPVWRAANASSAGKWRRYAPSSAKPGLCRQAVARGKLPRDRRGCVTA